jgi:hypothetical protein
MDESPHPREEQIIRSWNANTKPWSRAIQTGSIQSRTLVSWFSMLRRSGFEVLQCREPTAPGAAAPASVILICKARIREHTAIVV